jgi:hypothetical protein
MPAVAFTGSGLRYRICPDAGEGAIVTQVERDTGDGRLVADLARLVSAAGLGPANQLKRSARTVYSLRRSLESQAALVRSLHPLLAGVGGLDLLVKAGARRWRVQQRPRQRPQRYIHPKSDARPAPTP